MATRNDQLAAARGGVANDLREQLPVIIDCVIAIAVGGLDEDDVGANRIGRDPAAPAVVAAEVAAEQNRRPALEAGPHVRGAEQVPGRRELDRHSRGDLDRAMVADWLELRDRAMGIDFRIQRQRRLVLRVAVLVGLTRVLLLNPAGVGKHQWHKSAVPAVQITRPRNPCATSRGK